MKTLYIHMGMPKTGTSAIQNFLNKNQDDLYQLGYIYRYMPFHDYKKNYTRVVKTRNGYFLHGWRKDFEDYDQAENERRLDEGLHILNQWFREKDNIILTDESIFGFLQKWDFMDRVKKFADENGIMVKPIIFLRRQDESVSSLYRQMVKVSMKKQESYTDYMKMKKDKERYDYNIPLFYLRDLFGTEQVKVIVYEPAQWKKEGTNIFHYFFRSIDLPEDNGLKLPGKSVNPSISHNVCEIKRLINHIDPEVSKENRIEVNNLFRDACDQCSIYSPDPEKLNFCTQEESRAYMNSFADSNRQVAQEFFHRDKLFSEEISDYRMWERDNPQMLPDVILYFGLVTSSIYEKLLDQQRKLDRIRRWFPSYWFQKLKRLIKRIKNR
jgi:hypothetical protein